MNHRTAASIVLLMAASAAAPAVATATPIAAPAERELTVHGFRSPSMGVELRDGWIGFHLGLFPLIADDGADGTRTTWFAKTGLTAYPWRVDLGSGRLSGPFVSLSLMQGLDNEWNVATSVGDGAGVHGEIGFRWAVTAGLDLRLGLGVLVGSEGRVVAHPTPGISWTVAL